MLIAASIGCFFFTVSPRTWYQDENAMLTGGTARFPHPGATTSAAPRRASSGAMEGDRRARTGQSSRESAPTSRTAGSRPSPVPDPGRTRPPPAGQAHMPWGQRHRRAEGLEDLVRRLHGRRDGSPGNVEGAEELLAFLAESGNLSAELQPFTVPDGAGVAPW